MSIQIAKSNWDERADLYTSWASDANGELTCTDDGYWQFCDLIIPAQGKWGFSMQGDWSEALGYSIGMA